MSAETLDLGGGHTLRWLRWSPDRELNPQYADVPDIDRLGAIETHPRPDTGEPCEGGIYFDTPEVRALFSNREFWTVESWDPLTVSPSILCGRCGNHGFIRDGRWVPA